jgi:hypothetical protein
VRSVAHSAKEKAMHVHLKRFTRLFLSIALIVSVGCNSPSAPESETETPAPTFLIGDSPLMMALLKTTSGQAVARVVEVNVGVNRGIVQTKDEDKFQLRTTIGFSKDGGELFIGACIEKPAPDKDTELRGGSDVPVTIILVLTAAQYDALLAAAPDEGDTVDASALVELILTDGKGEQHVLDSASAKTTVDPRDAL